MTAVRNLPRVLGLALSGVLLLAACQPRGEAGAASSAQNTNKQNTSAQNNLDAAPPKVVRVPVTVTEVKQGTLQVARTVSATVGAARDSNVAAQSSGAVARVLVQEGERVGAGQVAVQLDDTTLRASVENARLSLQNARINLAQGERSASASTAQLRSAVQAASANLEKARSTYSANQRVYALGGLTRTDLEASRAALAQAEADLSAARTNLSQNGRSGSGSLSLLRNGVATAEASLRQAQDNLAKASVRAPFAGVVASVAAQEGEFVQTGATVFRLVDPATLKVEFNVSPAEAAALPTGAPVTVLQGGRQFAAKVSQGNRVAGSDRLVPITARLAGTDLPVGAVVQLRYRAQLGGGVLVPTSALQTEGANTSVFVASGGRAQERDVQVVAESQGQVAVRGLTPGAQVINPVPPSLQSGAGIEVSSAANAGGAP